MRRARSRAPLRGRISTRTVIVLLAAVVCVSGLAIVLYGPFSHDPDAKEKPSRGVAPPRLEPPPPPRPVPSTLRSRHEEIRRRQRARDFARAVEAYPAFLEELHRAWGPEARDLASYYYDFALALKLAGRVRECVHTTARALERWPDDLALQVLEATTRVVEAIGRRVFDPRADRLYRDFLVPANYPRLRGLRLKLSDLYAPWAEMLLIAGRASEALDLTERAVSLEGSDKCLGIKARALLVLRRGEEARAIFARLVLDTPGRRFEAGMAEEQAGNLEGAWKHYSAVLADQSGAMTENVVSQLRLRAATVLNGLGRPAEAAGLLADLLAEEPDDVAALNQLVVANRSRQRREATRALNVRVRRLAHRQSLLGTAAKAATAGDRGSVSYWEALAAADVHRLGDALARLDQGAADEPGLGALYRERARIRLLLGRHGAAEFELRRGSERTGDLALLADLARVQALRGQRAEMGRTIARIESLRETKGPADRRPDREAALDLGLARAWLESGDYARARESLGRSVVEGDAMAEHNLCLAELAWRDGRADESRELLDGNFQSLPGGEVWARALRVLATGGIAELKKDPSDILDHQRLFLNAPSSTGAAGVDDATLEHLRRLSARRGEILARMEGYSDRDAASGWKELLDLYLEVGAARKAREIAWFLVHLRPTSVSERQQLAATLSEDEEAVVRYSVLREAARLSPASPLIGRGLAEVSEFLGLGGPEIPANERR